MRRPFAQIALVAALAAWPATRGAESAGSGEDLLVRLGRISSVYSSTILRFACREDVLEESLEPGSGDLNSRRQAGYRYLLQAAPESGRVSEFRQLVSTDGVPIRAQPAVVRTYAPAPFVWTTLFDPARATTFRYEVVGLDRVGVTETLVIAFEGQLLYQQGLEPGEWSGRIWLDVDRLHPVRLDAEPARQDQRLKLEMDRFRRAFRIAGIPLRARPRSRRISVDFLVQEYGLRFPSRATWRREVLNTSGDRSPEASLVRRFTDYQFFDISSEAILEALGEGDGP